MLISAAATYGTQRPVRRGQLTEPVGTAVTVQRVMLYLIPASVLISGLFFPLGVLLYRLTSNVWTLGQQAYINRFHPHAPPPMDAHVGGNPEPPDPNRNQRGPRPVR